MKRSSERILTTHVGALAQSKQLYELIQAQARGEAVSGEELAALVKDATNEVVRKQVEVGLSIVNDGEQSKTSFSAYVRERLSGFTGTEVSRPVSLSDREFPAYATRRSSPKHPTCDSPVSWKDFSLVEQDIARLRDAMAAYPAEEGFLTAASPGTIVNHHPNRFYATREEYLYAVADAMQREYEAIVAAGFVLQVDCPDLALWSTWFPDITTEEFKKEAALNVEAMNHALRNVPPESVRVHVCWGRGEAPKNHDIPLSEIVDVLLQSRATGISIVGANGRHEHEWRVWRDVRRSEDMILIPGVVDNTTNFVEHPEVVADRIMKYASIVGRENVIAGLDCGFGNTPYGDVDPGVAWAKLGSLVEGARLASERLW